MQVGLVTPPGILGEYVLRTLAPAGHQLAVAPDLEALLEQAEARPEVVLFAPVVAGRPAAEELAAAEARGVRPERALYAGLSPEDCAHAQRVGFFRALMLRFQGRDLLDAIESSARGRLRVVLADDSELIHRHTVPILESAGYDVVRTWDGAEALAAVERERPDLLLTDVEMPKMNGYELCRAVKREGGRRHPGRDLLVARRGERSRARLRRRRGRLPGEAGRAGGAREPPARAPRHAPARAVASACSWSTTPRRSGTWSLIACAGEGFRIETAVDGKDGLEKALRSEPDLVLTDYDMPRMTGFELVLALRSEIERATSRIVMLTARDTGATRRRCARRASRATW